MFMIFMGEPIGYQDEKEGRIIHDIYPVRGRENRTEGGGSKTFFTYHTEDAIHPYRPDHLGLICLRADHDRTAVNETASVVEAIQHLPGAAVTLLRQPLFEVKPPLSFGETDLSDMVPVLSGSLFEPEMRIHGSFMKGVNPEAQWALDMLKESLKKVSISYTLSPGDMMIINNRLAAHARSSFTPRYDGKDRWLQRMYTVVDFHRSSFSRGRGEPYLCSLECRTQPVE